jgi:DNA-binding IclR family transcriptional regulator
MSILARLGAKEADEIVLRNRSAYREYGVVSADAIRRLIAETRRRGYAFSPGLVLPEVYAIGVPVVNHSGEPIAALSIATVASRMTPRRRAEMAQSLFGEAEEISRKLHP